MNTFPKHSRLCGQMRISQLYKEGQRFVVWPLRVTYMPISNQQAANCNQILVWAPKSLFKHAVQRNHLRRLMREAYRLNQHILSAERSVSDSGLSSVSPQGGLLIAFNYIDKEQQPYAVIEKAVCKALKKINGK